jgi:predicted ribosome quality control (RQC) complex YloA/Tae2 family protein
VDAISLDGLIAELRPALIGRHCRRVRLGAAQALMIDVGGEREARLWIDSGRGSAGVYLLDRAQAAEAQRDETPSGRARHALLHFRKQLEGARLMDLERVPGERTLVLTTTGGRLALRLSGVAPALSLIVADEALATLGEGPPAWPLPSPAPARQWHRLDAADFAAAVEQARRAGRSLPRAILAACPELGPALAQSLDGTAAAFDDLRARLAKPQPTLRLSLPVDECHDADLGGPGAVALLPTALERDGAVCTRVAAWSTAAAMFLGLVVRGRRFDRRRRETLATTQRQLQRLSRLETNLRRDLEQLPDAALLRRQAEALLASAHALTRTEGALRVPDPSDPTRSYEVILDGRVSIAANADRLYARARRVGAARLQIEGRLSQTSDAIASARRQEAGELDARDRTDLPTPTAAAPARAEVDESQGPRRYLTGRGLEILVGRSARENHELTFGVARPDDFWLHARDVPGAHVILRDRDGRADPQDRREAAEVAAFFSAGRGSVRVDVHVTPRKFVQPVKGHAGRVRITHSEVLRVQPLDPEGRLRRR